MPSLKSALVFMTVALASSSLWADCCACPQCGCTDGCTLRVVKRVTCHLEPDTKPNKKTIYECKRIPVCEHKLPPFLHPEKCPHCAACPKYKTVLIKKEVDCGDIHTTKCVAEETCVVVAMPCHHCGHRPKHPFLRRIFSHGHAHAHQAQLEEIDSENAADYDASLPEGIDANASDTPTHIATVDARHLEMLKQSGEQGVISVVGGVLEPEMIEADDLSAFQRRVSTESPVSR